MFTIINAIKTWVTAEINKIKRIITAQDKVIANKLDIADYVQSDWVESSKNSKAYIKNKPFGASVVVNRYWEADASNDTGEGSSTWKFTGSEIPFLIRGKKYDIWYQIAGELDWRHVSDVIAVSKADKKKEDPDFDPDGLMSDDDLILEFTDGEFYCEITAPDAIKSPRNDSHLWYNRPYPDDDDYYLLVGIGISGDMYDISTIPSRYMPEHFDEVSADYISALSASLGDRTKASASGTVAEGFRSCAYALYSHAEGQSDAKGAYSHAEGYRTTAEGDDQHVQGRYNIIDSGLAHIVGNGTSTTSSKRSNAHTLDWSGNAWFSGDVYVGSTSGKNKDEGSKKLATEDYVNKAFGSVVINKQLHAEEETSFMHGTRIYINNTLYAQAKNAFPYITYAVIVDGDLLNLIPTGKSADGERILFKAGDFNFEICPISSFSPE